MLKKILDVFQNLSRQEKLLKVQLYQQLLSSPKYADPKHLLQYGYQVFSQNDEDGILAEVIRRVQPKSKFFVECAAGEGMENNTRHLLQQGWEGIWVEADGQLVDSIRHNARQFLRSNQLQLLHEFVNRETFSSMLKKLKVPSKLGVLSLDIDGNDYWLWQSLHQAGFRPEVVVIEYNANLGPDLEWIHPYQADFVWDGKTINFGASLAALTKLAEEQGYILVGCTYTGTNAFFVRREYQKQFSAPFTPGHFFEPPRYGGYIRLGFTNVPLQN